MRTVQCLFDREAMNRILPGWEDLQILSASKLFSHDYDLLHHVGIGAHVSMHPYGHHSPQKFLEGMLG
jgi:hypothetical protein